MSETKASLDATIAATLATTQNATAATAETSGAGGTLSLDTDTITALPSIPETLTLIRGDLQKLCQGEDEFVVFACHSKTPQSSATTDKEKTTETKKDKDVVTTSFTETKQTEEAQKTLKFVAFTREKEQRDGRILSETPSLVMYFLFNCELLDNPKNHAPWAGSIITEQLVPKNFSLSHYFRTDDVAFPILFEKSKIAGLHFSASKTERCSVGLMTEAIAQNVFTSLEDYLVLEKQESVFFQSLCQFKTMNSEELYFRKLIQDLLSDEKNPKRYTEAVTLAQIFHEKILKKSKDAGLISCESSTGDLFLDDCSLAYDLALNLASVSPKEAINACEIYSMGAFFRQQAKQLMVSLVIGYTSDLSIKEQVLEIRQLRSKAMHAAMQMWLTGASDTSGIEMLLKLIEFQAGCQWSDPKDRLFKNISIKHLIGPTLSNASFMNVMMTLIDRATDAVYQYHSLSHAESKKAEDSKRSQELTSTSKGDNKQTEEGKIISEASSVKAGSKPQNSHPIVQWFSTSPDTLFPELELSLADKIKLKLPDTLRIISGNLEELLTNNKSDEIVIFEVKRNSESSSNATISDEAGPTSLTTETKECKEKAEKTLTHIQISRQKDVKFGKDKVEGTTLTLHLFFNSAFFQAPQENWQPVKWLSSLGQKLEDEDITCRLFWNFLLSFPHNKIFSGGDYCGLSLELMNPDFLEYIFQLALKHTDIFTLPESQYLRELFSSPRSSKEKRILKDIKRELCDQKWDLAIKLARRFHEDLQETYKSQELIISDFVDFVLDDSKVMFFLGEFLENQAPTYALSALELISESSPWYDKAQQKFVDIAKKMETGNTRENRSLRQKSISILFETSLGTLFSESAVPEDYIKMQQNLTLLSSLIAIQAGVSPDIFKILSPQALREMGMNSICEYVLGFVEPLIDVLYKYRQSYGAEPLLASQSAMTFAYSSHKDSGNPTLSLGGAGSAASLDLSSVRSLDDEDEVEADSGLSLTPFSKGGK